MNALTRYAGKEQRSYKAQQDAVELSKLREKVNKFQDLSGVTVLSDRYAWEGKLRDQAGELRAIMSAGVGNYFQSMSKLVLQMETLSRQVREQLVTQGALPEKPSLDDLCPHPKRHGRHELYLAKAEGRHKPRKGEIPVFCRACGAEGKA